MKYLFTILLLLALQFTSEAQQKTKNNSKPVKKAKVVSTKKESKANSKKTKAKQVDIKKKIGNKKNTIKKEGKTEVVAQKKVISKKELQYRPIMSKSGKRQVTGSISSSKGFRIVIYDGHERDMALKIKNQCSKQRSDMKSYVSYLSPNYRVKIGDFEDKKKAIKVMKGLLNIFPNAFVVPDIIILKKVKVTKVRR